MANTDTQSIVRLTSLASCAGCAAKMGPRDLARVLRPLRNYSDPALLVGLAVGDDAAVYRLSDDLALVQTLDFFPPIVDDPYTFGAVAAANALSDVYAMGGHPIMALNIVAWPDDLAPEILTTIFQGGADKVAEAGAIIAGGHTVTDREPKYGLCVTGLIDPAHIMTKGGARPGDVLALSKPIGTGVITTAAKNDRASAAQLAGAIESMLRLNRAASEAYYASGVQAATDVTGFGLLGHASEMAVAGDVGFEIEADAVPLLPGALELSRLGIWPGGTERNHNFVLQPDPESGLIRATLARAVPEELLKLLLDPQTSGGLLGAIPAERYGEVEQRMADAGLSLWRIGRVVEGRGITVV